MADKSVHRDKSFHVDVRTYTFEQFDFVKLELEHPAMIDIFVYHSHFGYYDSPGPFIYRCADQLDGLNNSAEYSILAKPKLSQHIAVYGFAERFGITALQESAYTNIQRSLLDDIDLSSFIELVQHVVEGAIRFPDEGGKIRTLLATYGAFWGKVWELEDQSRFDAFIGGTVYGKYHKKASVDLEKLGTHVPKAVQIRLAALRARQAEGMLEQMRDQKPLQMRHLETTMRLRRACRKRGKVHCRRRRVPQKEQRMHERSTRTLKQRL
ncbi:hypothetical protein CC80DRAFT_131900 [Byssothecium circinans]|uniref:BTB domain-containing protein n=1 Tax=Byssothecium circinans TaxID=147558 RepID=A0A6A5TNS6_9PLEO|nr:hypothetical protein CC80DRAFT_131900 [Byssothecium circinans]